MFKNTGVHAEVLYSFLNIQHVTKIQSHSEMQTEKGIKRLKRPQALCLG